MNGLQSFSDLFFLIRFGVVARLSAERQGSGLSIMRELAVRPLAAAGNLSKAVGE